MGSDASRPLQDDKLDIRVYHERQKNKSGLSGVHIINNLLQRPAVTIRDLDRISRSSEKVDSMLDRNFIKSQRKRFSCNFSFQSTGKKCYRTDKEAGRSRNHALSFQALQKALRPFGARLFPAGSSELGALNPWGYVVYCDGQWSAMRQVSHHELWVDVDPKLEKPGLVSAAELLRLQVGMAPQSRGLVFAVAGNLPPCPDSLGRNVARLYVDPRSVCRTSFNL